MTNFATTLSSHCKGQHRSGSHTKRPKDNWQPNGRMQQDLQLTLESEHSCWSNSSQSIRID
ncbi:Uncharacterized protein APZ42_002211 [Daphnia magna]|uniref:Uncharacterized protein n=1 Tax=Daphnia magna TaxID=35525 RepID=A0A164IFG6_9CRUS|nr:Uncharacterized protein APZ42_002211 [Daphnia magna]